MADIEWKGARWKAAHDELSLTELLTVMKGFGPMEVIEFEKPGYGRGELSLSLADDGSREVSLHRLEVTGEAGQGRGKAMLQWLKSIFRGPIYVEFAEHAAPESPLYQSLRFWIKMFRGGLIDGLHTEYFSLHAQMPISELDRIEEEIRSASGPKPMVPGK